MNSSRHHELESLDSIIEYFEKIRPFESYEYDHGLEALRRLRDRMAPQRYDTLKEAKAALKAQHVSYAIKNEYGHENNNCL